MKTKIVPPLNVDGEVGTGRIESGHDAKPLVEVWRCRGTKGVKT